MKRNYLLMLVAGLLVISSWSSVDAQVAIGGDGTVTSGAVLELDGAAGGLLLPRVDALPDATDDLKGLMYFLTADGKVYICKGEVEGWEAVGSSAIPALSLPQLTSYVPATRFVFARLLDPVGDPDGPAASSPGTLTVNATTNETSGALTYQWYSVPTNQYALPIAISTGGTSASYVVPAPAGTGVNNWGLKRYYCIVSNNVGSVKSEVFEVAVGCGARAADGGWLKFMCQNVGALNATATTLEDQATFTTYADATASAGVTDGSEGFAGKLFQWGRPNTGERNSAQAAGPVTSAASGTFYTNGTYPYNWNSNADVDFLWQGWSDGNHPCAAPWHVPTQQQWANIYRTDGSVVASNAGNMTVNQQGTANTWQWVAGTTSTPRTSGGYAIRPDGATTTLFLPAAGYRYNSNGSLYYVGAGGYYWSSTPVGTRAYYLNFSSTNVNPVNTTIRANGFSVRCVAQ
ncbi:MAG: fibrobacter succinogenes major paralogous domain-containing protein [Candidatus Symbiothrix sp.]|jgi:uncharacterized protein (TIGR02145 family)|nr:fibrobacter succinogenes major paralogous domain-containing protein [Candidatus Symbiothrix sp.]